MAEPEMSREWEKFIEENPVPPIYPDIPTARETIHKRGRDSQSLLNQPSFSVLSERVSASDATVTLHEAPGHKFRIRIYRPSTSTDTDKLPVLLYFHGGMWVAGDVNTEDFGARAIIAHGNELVVISYEYRLAPENDWRTIFSDGELALEWVVANASKYGGDVSKGLMVGGSDAGAHLAAITVIRARTRLARVKITGQILIVPIFIAQPDAQIPETWHGMLKSHTEMAAAPIMTEAMIQRYLGMLDVLDNEKRKGENFPVWADLGGLPPAYLAMDECDPIRDDGFLYEKLLSDAGVKTRVDFYKGLPNMFVQFPQLPTTARAGMELAAGVRWLLEVNGYFNKYQVRIRKAERRGQGDRLPEEAFVEKMRLQERDNELLYDQSLQQ